MECESNEKENEESTVEDQLLRLRSEDPTQYITLVKMHLSFTTDLPTMCDTVDARPVTSGTAGGWRQLAPLVRWLSGGTNNSSSGAVPPKRPDAIASPLTEESLQQIIHLIQYLGTCNNRKTEGIFRKCGSTSRQNELRSMLVDNSLPDPSLLASFSTHDIASLLKSFLADLSEPILEDQNFMMHCKLAEISEADSSPAQFRRRLKALQLMLLLLPPFNHRLLKCLLLMLHSIAAEKKVNKMSACNLGMVFAPHILCPRKLTPNELQQYSAVAGNAVSFMVQYAPQLFQVPLELECDIKQYWCTRAETESHEMSVSSHSVTVDEHDPTLAHTVFSFVDREETKVASSRETTALALAELYAHVNTLPDSDKKRRLVKQFNQASGYGTPKLNGGNKRAAAFKNSIKKRLLKSTARSTASASLPRTCSDDLLLNTGKKSGSYSPGKALGHSHTSNSPFITNITSINTPTLGTTTKTPKSSHNQHVRAKSWDNLTTPKNLRKCLFPPNAASENHSPAKRKNPSSGSVNCFKSSKAEECLKCSKSLTELESVACNDCSEAYISHYNSEKKPLRRSTEGNIPRASSVIGTPQTPPSQFVKPFGTPTSRRKLRPSHDFNTPAFKSPMLGSPNISLRSRLSQSLRDKKKRSDCPRVPITPILHSKPTCLDLVSVSDGESKVDSHSSTNTFGDGVVNTPSNTRTLLSNTYTALSQSPGSPLTNAVLQDNITQALVLTPRSRCPIVSDKSGGETTTPFGSVSLQKKIMESDNETTSSDTTNSVQMNDDQFYPNENIPSNLNAVANDDPQASGHNSKDKSDKKVSKVSLLRRKSTLKRKNKSDSNILKVNDLTCSNVDNKTSSSESMNKEDKSKSLSNISSVLRRSFRLNSRSGFKSAEKLGKISTTLSPAVIDEVDYCPSGPKSTRGEMYSPSAGALMLNKLKNELEIADESCSPTVINELRQSLASQAVSSDRNYRYSSSASQALGSFFKHLSSSSLAQIAERLKTYNSTGSPGSVLSPIQSEISNTSIASIDESPAQTSHNESLSMVFREYLASRSIVTSNECSTDNINSLSTDGISSSSVSNDVKYEKSLSVPVLENDTLYLSADSSVVDSKQDIRSVSCHAINVLSTTPHLTNSILLESSQTDETKSFHSVDEDNLSNSLLQCLNNGAPPLSSPNVLVSSDTNVNSEFNFVSEFEMGPLVDGKSLIEIGKENVSPTSSKSSFCESGRKSSLGRATPDSERQSLSSCSPESRSNSVLGTKLGTPKRAMNASSLPSKVHFETNL